MTFVLDIYAGAGGWSEGAAMLGLPSVGIELAHDPCLTAAHVRRPGGTVTKSGEVR